VELNIIFYKNSISFHFVSLSVSYTLRIVSLSSSVLCLFAALVVSSTALEITFQLTIRDNGKICSAWAYTGNNGFSYTYYQHRECISAITLETRNGGARICCQGMPLTTPSANFPK
jgi:hypothetical protein